MEVLIRDSLKIAKLDAHNWALQERHVSGESDINSHRLKEPGREYWQTLGYHARLSDAAEHALDWLMGQGDEALDMSQLMVALRAARADVRGALEVAGAAPVTPRRVKRGRPPKAVSAP